MTHGLLFLHLEPQKNRVFACFRVVVVVLIKTNQTSRTHRRDLPSALALAGGKKARSPEYLHRYFSDRGRCRFNMTSEWISNPTEQGWLPEPTEIQYDARHTTFGAHFYIRLKSYDTCSCHRRSRRHTN